MDRVMDEAALTAFLEAEFPQGGRFVIDAVTDRGVRARAIVDDGDIRPGGTLSGPAMFGLVDLGAWMALLSRVGPEALAVTTSAHIDFMRKPAAGVDLVCEAELLKLGRSLAVVSCLVYSDGGTEPVARASLTYSRPPKR